MGISSTTDMNSASQRPARDYRAMLSDDALAVLAMAAKSEPEVVLAPASHFTQSQKIDTQPRHRVLDIFRQVIDDLMAPRLEWINEEEPAPVAVAPVPVQAPSPQWRSWNYNVDTANLVNGRPVAVKQKEAATVPALRAPTHQPATTRRIVQSTQRPAPARRPVASDRRRKKPMALISAIGMAGTVLLAGYFMTGNPPSKANANPPAAAGLKIVGNDYNLDNKGEQLEVMSTPAPIVAAPDSQPGDISAVPANDGVDTYGEMEMPLDYYRQTSSYGVRSDPFTGRTKHHYGIDLAAPIGTPVYAAANGCVVKSLNDPKEERRMGIRPEDRESKSGYHGYGNVLEIEYNQSKFDMKDPDTCRALADSAYGRRYKMKGGLSNIYGHLVGRLNGYDRAEAGQIVRKGELVGYVGSTGRSSGPHLHTEYRTNGEAISPAAARAQYAVLREDAREASLPYYQTAQDDAAPSRPGFVRTAMSAVFGHGGS